MRVEIPKEVDNIIKKLEENGHEAYAVGGCVRDSVLGRIPSDWDITTSAKPEQVKKIFPRTIDTGILHGTVTVMINRVGYEVTTYRIDGEYKDARHPESVSFTTSLEEDLKRRDFTINAMAYNHRKGLVDIFGGMEDIQKGQIRCVGNPKERFSEDALRMLRGIRFMAQLNFSMEEATYHGIQELAPTIEKVSAERIQVELVKLLVSHHPEMIRMVYTSGLSKYILPELDVMMETQQNCKHHCYSVGEHTIKALTFVPADKVMRLSILLHDVGKPAHKTTDENGKDHFHGHPKTSGIMARKILRRLRFDNETINRVTVLVTYHDERPQGTEKSIRKAIVKMGPLAFPDIFEIKRADVLAQSEYHREEKLKQIQDFKEGYEKIIENQQCISMKQLLINGKDLQQMGVKQGPVLGKILKELFQEVVEDPSRNEKEYLKVRAKELMEAYAQKEN